MDSAHYIFSSVGRLTLCDQENPDWETTPYAEPINMQISPQTPLPDIRQQVLSPMAVNGQDDEGPESGQWLKW
jgi:hypothetical protein